MMLMLSSSWLLDLLRAIITSSHLCLLLYHCSQGRGESCPPVPHGLGLSAPSLAVFTELELRQFGQWALGHREPDKTSSALLRPGAIQSLEQFKACDLLLITIKMHLLDYICCFGELTKREKGLDTNTLTYYFFVSIHVHMYFDSCKFQGGGSEFEYWMHILSCIDVVATIQEWTARKLLVFRDIAPLPSSKGSILLIKCFLIFRLLGFSQTCSSPPSCILLALISPLCYKLEISQLAAIQKTEVCMQIFPLKNF